MHLSGCYNCSQDEYFDHDTGTCVPCSKLSPLPASPQPSQSSRRAPVHPAPWDTARHTGKRISPCLPPPNIHSLSLWSQGIPRPAEECGCRAGTASGFSNRQPGGTDHHLQRPWGSTQTALPDPARPTMLTGTGGWGPDTSTAAPTPGFLTQTLGTQPKAVQGLLGWGVGAGRQHS